MFEGPKEEDLRFGQEEVDHRYSDEVTGCEEIAICKANLGDDEWRRKADEEVEQPVGCRAI